MNLSESDNQVVYPFSDYDGMQLDNPLGDETATQNTIAETWKNILLQQPPPDALPDGWILHRSRSQPGYIYYWNQFTGESTWEPPFQDTAVTGLRTQVAALSGIVAETLHSLQQQQQQQQSLLDDVQQGQLDMNVDTVSSATTSSLVDLSSTVKSILRKNLDVSEPVTLDSTTLDTNRLPSDKSKQESTVQLSIDESTRAPDPKRHKVDTTSPEQVHVLHILKKHKDSRRPSSWRVPKITITKEKAREELQELLSIIHESLTPTEGTTHSTPQYDIEELRATFEELAKTESDCSSAKRGGDLGWFGRKKMQPAFEDASFSLRVGELSDIVDTSSGLHILLRLG